MKITMAKAGFKAAGKSRRSTPLDANEAEQVLADMFIALCNELQLSAPGGRHRRQLDIHPSRATAFARQFLAGNQLALHRKESIEWEPGELSKIGSGGGGSHSLPMNAGFVSTPGAQF